MKLYTACGTEFEIDDEDYPLLEGMTFSLKGGYVGCWDGERLEYLHRILMPDNECDHIDRNKMNNRRSSNLRYATRGENCQNRSNWGKYPKGISYDPKKKLFRARIQHGYERIGLGRYKKLEDAINIYNEAARQFYGEHAALSKIEE